MLTALSTSGCGGTTAREGEARAPQASPAPAGSPEADAIALRNTTHAPVEYRLTPLDPAGAATTGTLEAGAVVHVPSAEQVDLDFESAGRRLEYRLDPGSAYAFRHDHNGELDLFLGSHGRADVPDLAPYVPTPMFVVERMLELAAVGREDVVYDLGCGDGRIVIAAAERYGARGVGVDLEPRLIEAARQHAREAGVEERVEFRVQDATAADFSRASVVTLYLLPESNELLRPLLEERLAPGSRVVSHNYEMPGWTPVREETLHDDDGTAHYLFAYVLGRHLEPGG